MAKKSKLPAEYENNPFFIAVNGMSLLFNLAKGIGFVLVAVSIVGAFQGNWSPDTSRFENDPAKEIAASTAGWGAQEYATAAVAIGIVVLAVMMISALFGGVSAYTSLKLSRGENVGIGEAFRVAFDRLWSYLWLQLIIFVKIVLWTLLLIVPGIIMATRYSLAGVAFFDDTKDLRGNAAVKESLRLTRGAWITTYGANTLFNVMTLGLISTIVTTSVNAVLYRQYDKLGDTKPEAHWLSWFSIALPFIILLLLLLVVLAIVVFLAASGAKFSE